MDMASRGRQNRHRPLHLASRRGSPRWRRHLDHGLWINSEDLARFGLLALNNGKWGDRQLVSAQRFRDGTFELASRVIVRSNFPGMNVRSSS
jgi:CubicO group peptidase (beta-lactamase class C family)